MCKSNNDNGVHLTLSEFKHFVLLFINSYVIIILNALYVVVIGQVVPTLQIALISRQNYYSAIVIKIIFK